MSIVENCNQCNAYCCRHVALHIDPPKNKSDFDTIRWYLMHENIWVSIDHNGDWLLEMRTPCRYIDKNYKCKIYQERPKICKEYPAEDVLCERQSEEPAFKYLFTNEYEFEKYLNDRGINWQWKKNIKEE